MTLRVIQMTGLLATPWGVALGGTREQENSTRCLLRGEQDGLKVDLPRLSEGRVI
jgi:hypothetical protein